MVYLNLVIVCYVTSSLACSGVIGFLLCATKGPPVDFVNPINPIEKLEGANEHKRELRFYNSEVKYMVHVVGGKKIQITNPIHDYPNPY